MDDDRLMRVYEIAERKQLPLIIHTGDYRYDYSHPRRLKRILHEFPRLKVDAAHFGGWSIYDYALEFLEDEKCYLDMSSSMRFLGPRRTRELVEAYGYDRILFGSDFPMWTPTHELEVFRALGFSARAYDQMCWYNAERFLSMDL
jgi:predicted TIM-barrel fold metal-dependent hydrolase